MNDKKDTLHLVFLFSVFNYRKMSGNWPQIVKGAV